MSRTFHHGERRIRVRGVRKDPPDLRRLGRALIELASLEAEEEAKADHKARNRKGAAKREPKNSSVIENDGGEAA